MPEDTASRRTFLRNACVVAAAGVAGYVVARTSGAAKPKSPGTEANGYGPPSGGGKYLAPLTDVPAQGGGLILPADKVVLVREAGGALNGFSAICTHEGCTVASVVKGVISCPCHGSQYSAVTGDVIQGPATRPLHAVSVVVRDGYVYTAL